MARKRFKLSHSILGGVILLIIEGVISPMVPTAVGIWIVCLSATLGSIAALYVATEIIEEVRGPRHMLALLSVLVGEFVIFFAFQYSFMQSIDITSFTIGKDWVTLLLHSTMVFVFNPIYTPADTAGQMLLLINTLSSLGLVLFILQNVWQFRRD